MWTCLTSLVSGVVRSPDSDRRNRRRTTNATLCRCEPLEPRLLLAVNVISEAFTSIGPVQNPVADTSTALKGFSFGGFDFKASTPKGPVTGAVGESLTYTTKGDTSAHKFAFRWGDGTQTEWKIGGTKRSHVFTKPGTYKIRAAEKCTFDLVTGKWSAPLTVVIGGPEPVPNGTAPVLDGDADLSLDAINEDDGKSSGTSVAALLLSGGDPVTDADKGALEGIAIVGADTAHGKWQYSINDGQSWSSLGTVSDKSARLLASTDKVRFIPSKNWNGTVDAVITFRAWDMTSGSEGLPADATKNGSKTAFSAAKATASITVNPVNDAPVLNTNGDMRLYTISDPTDNPGTQIAEMIANAGGDRITDVDADAVEGIAVTAVNNSHGTWNYSIDDGTTWLPFVTDSGAPSRRTARLLRDTDWVQFVPAADFQGLVSSGLTFRAWDQSSGEAGGEANASTNGGITAFSGYGDTVRVVVGAVTVTKSTSYKGDSVTVSLSGPGSCELYFDQNGVDLVQIILTGTTTQSSLTISVDKKKVGGAGLITLAEIDFAQVNGVDSHLGSLKGSNVDLSPVDPPNINPLPPDSVSKVQLHNYSYPAKNR